MSKLLAQGKLVIFSPCVIKQNFAYSKPKIEISAQRSRLNKRSSFLYKINKEGFYMLECRGLCV